jgi:hypothetical protein
MESQTFDQLSLLASNFKGIGCGMDTYKRRPIFWFDPNLRIYLIHPHLERANPLPNPYQFGNATMLCIVQRPMSYWKGEQLSEQLSFFGLFSPMKSSSDPVLVKYVNKIMALRGSNVLGSTSLSL